MSVRIVRDWRRQCAPSDLLSRDYPVVSVPWKKIASPFNYSIPAGTKKNSILIWSLLFLSFSLDKGFRFFETV